MMENTAYLVAVASALGTIANSFQKKWCFYVWGCTNAFWIIYNFSAKQYAQMLLYVFNFATCIIGLIKWENQSFWESFKDASLNLKKLEKPYINENEEKLLEIFGAEAASEMISRANAIKENITQHTYK